MRAMERLGQAPGYEGDPMRVMLFTDTLGDVNGVSRFIQNIASEANETGRDLQVVTSTSFETPGWANIHNLAPRAAMPMPGYAQLDVVAPPRGLIRKLAQAQLPDVIHISTPGPVGIAGRSVAKKLGVPMLGVYHTDFPAYVDHLFDDGGFTWIAARYMRWFYRSFQSIFTRSSDYVESLVSLGLPRARMLRLMPGIETERFHPHFRDDAVWKMIAGECETLCDLARPAVRVLSVGRVSVEKNLLLLAKAWPRVRARLQAQGVEARLVVVGDGPYRSQMEEELAGKGAFFLGFRHGEELSAIYASSDLFVFPSMTDTLGQVVMESQASGLAVIVSDAGGPKEVVEDGVTGLVLDGEAVEDWVEAIVNFAVDEAKRRAMGEAAALSMTGYDIAHSFEHFWKVHEEAVG